jgi:hypothetical protein
MPGAYPPTIFAFSDWAYSSEVETCLAMDSILSTIMKNIAFNC